MDDTAFPIENQILLGTDHAGSRIRQVLAQTHDGFAYTPYGYSKKLSCRRQKIGFSGQLAEIGTGLYSLGNGYRAYSASLLRFLSPDSLSPFDEGGANAYAYCIANPLSATDPSGHFARALFSKAAMIGFSRGMIAVGGLIGLAGVTLLASNQKREGFGALAAAATIGITGMVLRYNTRRIRDQVKRFLPQRPQAANTYRQAQPDIQMERFSSISSTSSASSLSSATSESSAPHLPPRAPINLPRRRPPSISSASSEISIYGNFQNPLYANGGSRSPSLRSLSSNGSWGWVEEAIDGMERNIDQGYHSAGSDL